MNVLLAGGAGYIGSHTAVELLNAGYEVIIADDYSNSCPAVISRIERITGKNVSAYEIDVKDKAAVSKVFVENKIGTVNSFAQIFSCSIDMAVQVPLPASARHRNGNYSERTTFAY